jgi:transposase
MPRKLLRDEQWEKIRDLLPGKAGDPGARGKDNRLFVEAVLWIARTGSPWRDLDPALGNWHATYTRFSRWSKKGVWQRVIQAVSHDRNLQALFIDSTVVRAHQHAAGAQKKPAPRRSGARAAG